MFKKHQLLDPIETISKLILLNFHPDGTKISFNNNRLNLIPPCKTQGIERFYSGDSRNNVCILGNAINNFVKLYVIPSEVNTNLYEKLNLLGKFACMGLKKLQNTYFLLNDESYDNCTYTIQYFIYVITNKIIPNIKNNNLFDEEKLKILWDYDDIDQIYRQFVNCFDNDGNPIDPDNILVSKNLVIINSFIDTMYKHFCKLLQYSI